jgi:hypothetical protein
MMGVVMSRGSVKEYKGEENVVPHKILLVCYRFTAIRRSSD